jgi:hypothetical protein
MATEIPRAARETSRQARQAAASPWLQRAELLAAGGGLAQFFEAYRAGFRRDLRRSEMSPEERRAADFLGRFGLVGRGVTFVVVGWFLVQAGLHHDPAQAHGYGGAFVFLLDQPMGRWLLGVTAAGFVALGLHSLACARWIRLLGRGR